MAVADPAHPLSVRLHHRCGRARRLHRRLLRLCRDRAREGRQRRGHTDRRSAQAAQRPRHSRPLFRGSGQVRLRLGRAPHGMPDGGAWLRRHCALARARRNRSQRRYRRRYHQICPDRQRPHPRDLRACGRRPPCGRGGAGRTDARRASRAGDRAGVRRRSAPASPAAPSGSQADRRAHGPHDHGHDRPAATRRARAAPDGH